MSINVTVHGNPISIKKGKMVTYDADSEFEHRRRIRLQQVREQSKEIAADVRNRVRKEKEKHLSRTEQKGEKDLKRWQARKLLALQQQYQECLKEVGSAHTQAALEPDPDEVLKEQYSKNQAEADRRQKLAAEKNRIESETKRLESEKANDLKKQTRKFEDERAAMVAKLGKPKRKKLATDIDIRNKLVTESDTSENISDAENISDPENISDAENVSANIIKDSKIKKNQKINITVPDTNRRSDRSSRSRSRNRSILTPSSSSRNRSILTPSSPSRNRSILTPNSPSRNRSILTPNSPSRNRSILTPNFPSRNRSILTPNSTPASSPKKRKARKSKTKQCIGKKCGESDDNLEIKNNEICDILPYVPTTSLRPSQKENIKAQSCKVKYYDHINRFNKEYVTPSVVQRISKDSIEVHPPSERSDTSEIRHISDTRDKIAHDRGVRAMEKERMQKEYDQLMKELPLLQKQERLAQSRTHHPTFHMPEDRLEQLEKRRQSKIENIFEKYYHKSKTLETPLVTIVPVQKTPPNEELKLPFKALDITEPTLHLNVGEWTTENNPQVTETFSQTKLAERQKALIDLLQRVNKQRELLLQEVSTLPPSSNLHLILQEDKILNLICPCCPEEEESKEDYKKNDKKDNRKTVATSTICIKEKDPSKFEIRKSVATNTTSIKEKDPSKSEKCRCFNTSTSSSSDVKKKHHKPSKKTRKRKAVNRNEETQTSPLLESRTAAVPSVDSQELTKPLKPVIKTCQCDDIQSPCPCYEIYRENMKKSACDEKCPRIEKHKEDKKKSSKLYESKQATAKNPYIKKYDDVNKLCEIVIKASKQTDVEIHKEEDNNEKTGAKRVTLNISKPTIITINSPTNGNDGSSSTTYMSLPQKPKVLSESQKKRQQYKDLLHYKPQQTNLNSPIDPNRKEITPNLLKYIQKLLSMSRQSIDELTVSSISDVSTPGHSIVDTSENNPFVKLQNVMNYYNLSISDIQKHLSASDESNASLEISARERRTEFIQEFRSGTNKSQDHLDGKTSHREPDTYSSICIVPQKPKSPKLSPPPRSPKSPQLSPPSRSPKSPQFSPPPKSPRNHEEVAEIAKETFGLRPDDMQEIPYTNIVSKYKDLTNACCDRISKLTEMIDNVRIEKERLLSPNTSDRYETSLTSYLDLPKFTDSYRSNGNQSAQQSNGNSTNSSMSQDAVDRYLLAVDKGLAGNISSNDKRKPYSPPRPGKQISPKKQESPRLVSTRTTSPPPSPPDKEKRKKSPTNRKKGSSPRKNEELPVSDNPSSSNNSEQPFVPMLQGIPKYSPPSEDQAGNYLNSPIKQFLLNGAKSKPPPALLRNVTKFNLNIDLTPHELSTIAEMDTIASSRNVSEIVIPRPRSPEDIIPSRDDSEESGFITLMPQQFQTSPREEGYCDPCSRRSSQKHSSRSCSPPQEQPVSNTDLSGVQPLNSERSTSSPEDMEVMLRSMGLGWAISTLKKTHEALALSSSTSSMEASFRKRVSFKGSSSSSTHSDVSLKDVLNKELMRKISSSTLISNTSGISPNLQELQDISEIRDPTIFNKDCSQQRTSTPVMHSKSTDSKKDLFTGDSDISSVRMHSEEFFLSIPNVSLDTNKTLSKSKE